MNRFSTRPAAAVAVALLFAACGGGDSERTAQMSEIERRLAKYTTVRLTSDLSGLSDRQKKLLPLLIDAAQEMDALFWEQAYGDRAALLASIDDADTRRFTDINYGPWDRLAGNEPFVEGVGPKPKGANFYPHDMTREEFEQAVAGSNDAGQALKSLYTLVRRDPDGKLVARPYHETFRQRLQRAADKLRQAASLADDPGFKRYLELRAEALLSDDYRASDLAWMDMKNNRIDVVIGPIENYEDQLFGYKTAYEAFVLIKDMEWSKRLSRYASFLPMLQRGLPVPEAYKPEMPGTDSDLNAYDVVYYAGDCNAGSKTIAINLPNDEQVQLQKGTRRLQLKNAMRAKFDRILVPITGMLIAEDQRANVTFDAFFANTMFHEVAHGLGIKNTIDGTNTVRKALKDRASALEEGKADILGLYMIQRLHEQGELAGTELADNYVTFIASIFRSVRFGAASAHGRANLARFNFFVDMQAIRRDEASGTWRVELERVPAAMTALSEKILRLQGDGDYDGATRFMEELGRLRPELQSDLDRLGDAGIPVDIVFEQGSGVLGL